MAKAKITKKKIQDVIAETHGIKQAIAERLNVDRRTIYRFFDRYSDLEKECQEYLDTLTDIAESHLIASVKAGNSWAVRYWLSTRGKHRGYSTKLENTFNSSNPMQTIGIKIGGQTMQEIITGVADSNE